MVTLPSQIFCDVNNPTLLGLIEKERGNRVMYDCGCGMAQLGSLLKKVISIDICIRENSLSRVIYADCTTMPFNENTAAIFIRPCHNGFVYKTILNNIDKFYKVLYIGLKKNIKNDLEDFEFREVPGWTGDEGENLYVIDLNPKFDRLNTYCLLKTSFWGEYPSWMMDGGHRWVNDAGGEFPKDDKIEILETVQAADIFELDWTKTRLGHMQEDEREGWLSPSGRFYQASYHQHDTIALYIIKKNVYDLEREGWLRLSKAYEGNYFVCDDRTRLTAEQKNWLRERGFVSILNERYFD